MEKLDNSKKERRKLKSSGDEDRSKKICRICLEENDSEMISPCACFGYSKYVHEECLKTWIKIKFQNFEEAICEVCKEKFSIKRIRHINCKKKIDSQDITFTFIKVLIIGIVMFISSFGSMIIMILFLDKGKYSIFFGLSLLIFLPAILFSIALIANLLFKICIEVTFENVLGTYESYSTQAISDRIEPNFNQS